MPYASRKSRLHGSILPAGSYAHMIAVTLFVLCRDHGSTHRDFCRRAPVCACESAMEPATIPRTGPGGTGTKCSDPSDGRAAANNGFAGVTPHSPVSFQCHGPASPGPLRPRVASEFLVTVQQRAPERTTAKSDTVLPRRRRGRTAVPVFLVPNSRLSRQLAGHYGHQISPSASARRSKPRDRFRPGSLIILFFRPMKQKRTG